MSRRTMVALAILSLVFSSVVVAETDLTLPDSVLDPGFQSNKATWLAANDGAQQNAAAASGGKSAQPSNKELGDALANPLSYLWLMFLQNDTQWMEGDALDALGEETKVYNTTLVAPVMSLQLTEAWKMIFRPVVPILSVPSWSLDCKDMPDIPGACDLLPDPVRLDRETGIGDIILWTAFSNRYKPPFIFGFGPTLMLDTASDERLGTGKWSAGPMALGFYVSDKWIIGAVAQQWWSFAGDDDREDVSLMDLQYVARYRLTPTTNIGFGPNIRANWEAPSDKRWTVPVGIGADTLVKLGPLPVKVGAEVYYYVERPDDFGPEWQLRLMMVPVLPAPEWSRKPLFDF